MKTAIFTAVFMSLVVACAPARPGPVMSPQGVRFSLYAPKARTVAIAGSFNAWDVRKDRLAGPGKDGFWTIVLPLFPVGRSEYLFIVDGKDWHSDPGVPEVDDGFGGKNSVIIVP